MNFKEKMWKCYWEILPNIGKSGKGFWGSDIWSDLWGMRGELAGWEKGKGRRRQIGWALTCLEAEKMLAQQVCSE